MNTVDTRYSSPGFTLVEVLLALALMGAVLTAGMRLVRQNLVVEQSLRAMDTRRIPEDAVFDLLQRDLDGVSAQPGAIRVSEGVLLNLTASARFDDAGARQSSLLPAEVLYHIERHDDANWLIRELKDLTVEKPVVERLVLLRDVEHTTLRVHDGREWLPATEATLQKAPVALEVRVGRTNCAESCRIYLLGSAPNTGNEGPRAQR
jgi:prepilin-type N-terminal cleavage/methylation domain-containing protein